MEGLVVTTLGSASTLQTFFADRTSQDVAILTPSQATPITHTITPSVETLAPATIQGSHADTVIVPGTSTITPKLSTAIGADPSGILRVPIPPNSAPPNAIAVSS